MSLLRNTFIYRVSYSLSNKIKLCNNAVLFILTYGTLLSNKECLSVCCTKLLMVVFSRVTFEDKVTKSRLATYTKHSSTIWHICNANENTLSGITNTDSATTSLLFSRTQALNRRNRVCVYLLYVYTCCIYALLK